MAALVLLVSALACGGETPLPEPSPETLANTPEGLPTLTAAGERILSIDITTAEDGDFDAAVGIAKEAGATATCLAVYWDYYETSPGVYEPEEDWLEVANDYYPKAGLDLTLTLSVIDTNQKRVPADLMDRPFDDPEMIARFSAFLDHVFSRLQDVGLISLAIGNEIDIYLENGPDTWEAYQTFYEATAEYARSIRPGLPIGTKTVFYGDMMKGEFAEVQAINRASDVILVTYYPLDENGMVHTPSVVRDDFDALAAAFPGKPIEIRELGYPSSELLGSSEQQQAEFVRGVFRAWDAHADQITLVVFAWLTDVSEADLEFFETYYGSSDPKFVAFLGTLGMRTYVGLGADKPAFIALKEEAHARDW
jgi:hypothetical protein